MTNAASKEPASKEPASKEERAILSSALLASDAVGRLIEFWGFKRNMGRVWTLLYLSPEPLTADDLRDLLKISTGAVSMTLTELQRWDVVRKVWIQGERSSHFEAEVHIWRMISRVWNDRERGEIVAAARAFQDALAMLKDVPTPRSGSERRRYDLQRERIQHLLDLAELGRRLVEMLIATAKLDAEPLARFLLLRPLKKR